MNTLLSYEPLRQLISIWPGGARAAWAAYEAGDPRVQNAVDVIREGDPSFIPTLDLFLTLGGIGFGPSGWEYTPEGGGDPVVLSAPDAVLFGPGGNLAGSLRLAQLRGTLPADLPYEQVRRAVDAVTTTTTLAVEETAAEAPAWAYIVGGVVAVAAIVGLVVLLGRGR